MRSAPKRVGSCVSSSTSAGRWRDERGAVSSPTGTGWSGVPHSAWRRVHPSDRSPRGPSSDRRQTVTIPLMLNIVYPMWTNVAAAGNRVPGGHQTPGPTPGTVRSDHAVFIASNSPNPRR